MIAQVACAAVLATVMVVGAAGTARAATNLDIITLAKNRVGDEAILAKIATEPCGYDLTIPGIRKLKVARVSNGVIAAMIRKCSKGDGLSDDDIITHELGLHPGLFGVDDASGGSVPQQIVPAMVAAGLPGGNGTVLLPAKSKLTLPGARSGWLTRKARPVFWIVADPATSIGQPEVTSPSGPPGYDHMRLVRLDQRTGKRQLYVGTVISGVAIGGVYSRSALALRIVRRSRSLFVAIPETDLDPGEYALLVNDKASTYRVYDFTVDRPDPAQVR